MAKKLTGDQSSTGSTTAKIPVGISACTLGQSVRFDGGHKHDRYISETLGQYFLFVAVCPEVEIGLPIPRESLRLIKLRDKSSTGLRLVANQSGHDHSRAMQRYAKTRLKALQADSLCGYIVQKNSPSCGMERVRVYPERGGSPQKNGRGLFTDALMKKFPLLPVEENGRLNDPILRENFIERVFAYRRLREFFSRPWTMGQLVSFHACEKLLLMAHDRPSYLALGRLVATGKNSSRADLQAQYQQHFMQGLARIATRSKHSNVLQHISGYFKKTLDAQDRQELQELIEQYRLGRIPLVVPLTLLQHHLRRHPVPYLLQQTYMSPHPVELMLRNHG